MSVRLPVLTAWAGLACWPVFGQSSDEKKDEQKQPDKPAPAPAAPPVEDFKPASSNQPGKQYPQVNSERRIRFRVVAPDAKSVKGPEWGGVQLVKGADGAWVGVSRPVDEGFHYYRINVDGADVPDPGSRMYYGASRWGSGIEVPAKDEEFYAVKNVPHGQLRENLYFSKSTNRTLDSLETTHKDAMATLLTLRFETLQAASDSTA